MTSCFSQEKVFAFSFGQMLLVMWETGLLTVPVYMVCGVVWEKAGSHHARIRITAVREGGLDTFYFHGRGLDT